MISQPLKADHIGRGASFQVNRAVPTHAKKLAPQSRGGLKRLSAVVLFARFHGRPIILQSNLRFHRYGRVRNLRSFMQTRWRRYSPLPGDVLRGTFRCQMVFAVKFETTIANSSAAVKSTRSPTVPFYLIFTSLRLALLPPVLLPFLFCLAVCYPCFKINRGQPVRLDELHRHMAQKVDAPASP